MINLFYSIIRGIFFLLFKYIYRYQVKGRANIPKAGALVVMSNHISYLDPPIISCIMDRPIYFMAKEELFQYPIFGWLIGKLGAFPVKRGRPDRGALKKSYDILANDQVLCIFPEGQRYRNGKLGNAKSGAIMIPIKKECPILPVGIKLKKMRLKVSIGQPLLLDQYFNRKIEKEEIKAAGRLIMKNIEQELDQI